jgi:hypothetical protein
LKTRAKFSVTATFPETFIKGLYVGEMKLRKLYMFEVPPTDIQRGTLDDPSLLWI